LVQSKELGACFYSHQQFIALFLLVLNVLVFDQFLEDILDADEVLSVVHVAAIAELVGNGR